MVGVPHRSLLPSLPTSGGGRAPPRAGVPGHAEVLAYVGRIHNLTDLKDSLPISGGRRAPPRALVPGHALRHRGLPPARLPVKDLSLFDLVNWYLYNSSNPRTLGKPLLPPKKPTSRYEIIIFKSRRQFPTFFHTQPSMNRISLRCAPPPHSL